MGTLSGLQRIGAESASQGAGETGVSEHLEEVRVEMVTHPWTGITGTDAPMGTKVDGEKIIPKGFHILPRRWVMERTNAWMTHHRRLSRDVEGTHTSSEAFLSLAMSTRMLARFARDHP